MRTIVYLSVSVDGAVTGFVPDMELHYGILGKLKADAILVGSVTAKTGIETFMKEVPAETEKDRLKPAIADGDRRAYWVLVDSTGALQGLLHVYRQMGYCKDVIVLTSDKTPPSYIRYLDERGYDHSAVGNDKVDLRAAYALLGSRYGFKTIVTDAGSILPSALLAGRMVDEVHFLVVPLIVGGSGRTVFHEFAPAGGAQALEFMSSEQLPGSYVLLKYKVRYA